MIALQKKVSEFTNRDIKPSRCMKIVFFTNIRLKSTSTLTRMTSITIFFWLNSMKNSEKGGVPRKSFRESPNGLVNRRSQHSLVVKCLRIPNLVSENFSLDAKKRGDLKHARVP